MQMVQIIIIVLIILIVIGVVAFLVMGGQSKTQKRKLDVIRGSQAAAHNPADDQNKRRDELAKKLKEQKNLDGDPASQKVTISIQLGRAGLDNISTRMFWIMSLWSMLGFLLLAKLMGQPVFVIAMAGVIGMFGFPKLVLKKMAAKRQKKFLEGFPDALEAMVRLLKAGMPVAESVSMIAREFDGPVGEEMSKMYDKQKIGVPLHEAAYEAARTMPITEMQMFATGLAIQAQTGSSLSEVLMNLSGVIRARFRLKRKIKALSSEAIASASIIGALPILVASGMYFVNYEYIRVLFDDSFGNVLLGIAGVSMCIGIFVMKAMINFKV